MLFRSEVAIGPLAEVDDTHASTADFAHQTERTHAMTGQRSVGDERRNIQEIASLGVRRQ